MEHYQGKKFTKPEREAKMRAVVAEEVEIKLITVEHPPDGGVRAWLIVLACAVMNACNELIYYLFMSTILIPKIAVMRGGEQVSVYSEAQVFENMRLLGEALAAPVAIRVGFRVLGIFGGILLTCGFLLPTWLDPQREYLFHVLVGFVAGLGLSFWRFSANVAILEYFKQKRMKAIILAGFGGVVGTLGGYGIITGMLKPVLDDSSSSVPDWVNSYRYILMPVAVGTIAGVTLGPLKLSIEGRKKTSITQGIIGVQDWTLFKDVTFWLILFVYMCFYCGAAIPVTSILVLLTDSSFSNSNILTSLFTVGGGAMFGCILLMFWRRKTFRKTLTVVGPVCLVAGIQTAMIPAFTPSYFVWIAVCLTLYGATRVLFEAVLHDVVPMAFGRQHIRLLEGFIGLFAGVGTAISNVTAANLLQYNGSYDNQFYLAGGALFLTGIIVIVSRYLLLCTTSYVDKNLEQNLEVPLNEAGGPNATKPSDQQENSTPGAIVIPTKTTGDVNARDEQMEPTKIKQMVKGDDDKNETRDRSRIPIEQREVLRSQPGRTTLYYKMGDRLQQKTNDARPVAKLDF